MTWCGELLLAVGAQDLDGHLLPHVDTWFREAQLAVRAIFAAVLGGIIGLERRRDGKDHSAGIRTYAAVSLGACVFGLVSWNAGQGNADRIAAQVVTGIGFLGAGIIIQDRGKVKGLTTSATLWTSAAVGLAVAYGLYMLATLTAAIIYALLAVHRLAVWKKWISPPIEHPHSKPDSEEVL